MSLADAMNKALDGGEGLIRAEHSGATAEVDVVAAGPVGVRVRGLKVHRGRDVSIAEAAEQLPEQLARVLPERVVPVEVDAGLGGAVLRTKPGEMRDAEFIEVELRGSRSVEVRRWRVEGEREPIDWAMTRDQLGRLLDALE